MNEKNLIPFSARSASEARESGRKGGIASGKARRRKRSMKAAAELYLSLPVADRNRWNELAQKGIEPDDIDNQMAIIVGLAEAGAAGDSRAAAILLKMLGEDAPQDGSYEDALKRAAELLKGIESAIE